MRPGQLKKDGLPYRIGLHLDIRPDGELPLDELMQRFGCTKNNLMLALARLESLGMATLVARSNNPHRPRTRR